MHSNDSEANLETGNPARIIPAQSTHLEITSRTTKRQRNDPAKLASEILNCVLKWRGKDNSESSASARDIKMSDPNENLEKKIEEAEKKLEDATKNMRGVQRRTL